MRVQAREPPAHSLLVVVESKSLISYLTSCGGACDHACGGGGLKMSAHEVVTVCVHASHRRSRCCIGIGPPRASLKGACRQRSGRRPRWVSRSCSGRRLWRRRRLWRNRNHSGMIVVRPYLLCRCGCLFGGRYVVKDRSWWRYSMVYTQVDRKEGRERGQH